VTNWHRTAVLQLLKLSDLAVIAVAFAAAVALAVPGDDTLTSILEARIQVQNVCFVVFYLGFAHLVLHAFGLYRSHRLSPSAREWRDVVGAVLVAAVPPWVFGGLLRFDFATRTFPVVFVGIAAFALGIERRCMRVVARNIRRYGRDLRHAIIVGDGERAFDMASRLARRADLGYRVVATLEVDARDPLAAAALVDRLAALAAEEPVDEVFVALPLDGAQVLIGDIVGLCEEQGITLRLLSSIVDLRLARAQLDEIDGRPILSIFTGPPDSVSLLVKRLLDLAVAVAALIVLSPVLALVALAIRLDSRGPVLFVQERVGLNGRRFRFFKFRTMVEGAENMQQQFEAMNEARGPVFKIRRDPRITRVGRWIRRLSLDELPQLLNVVRGEMSLVGPRPLPLRDVSRIDVRAHKRRMSVKPGITCLWQIDGREPEFEDWIRTDMQYIDNWSLALDVKILLKTIPAVLSGRGAY
jgi:exopolysaccharide biosynthesis polyprenyl glycosylphosphotransferase